MFSTLLHPRRYRQRASSSFSSAFDSPVLDRDAYRLSGSAAEGSSTADEDNEPENSPLLPIFAANLDSIPVYKLVHAIRSEVCATVDTTLTWEQLRTPQVSSFVVKPILSTLMQMEDSVSKGIIYSLMANCFQFRKEQEENPGSAGTSRTRGLLCELLAIKLLKEFSTRELIDALSYDFYPLQGTPPPTIATMGQKSGTSTVSRISALEISIRAQAKKFLSQPVVIQHLEAIWAGNIVFHSAYDQMHRIRDYGPKSSQGMGSPSRRSATIYDGRHASLFKLSRLRIPRYRHIFSTISLAVLLFLHLRVLMQRSYTITPLEILFWLWSFGFMVDEIADFTESGVSLYFMSMWNAFDFGIFLLFMTFYALRIVGLFIPGERDYITDWSFDILGSCSIFLFPRIFSILDHYRYFSQLIIAFRIMAADMMALLVLIVVSCSGFFVAFTFSFAREYSSAKDVSYTLFQIVMGFTPAAWESWPKYNLLGKFLLTAFLIICHFLIVTILITVLTNSFALVVANSVEEHQFLVAVNTISLVKNEAIFTYLAPTNLIAWALHPLRYFMRFRNFVKLNRIIVKITHFPLLAAIYIYERTMLQTVFVPADAVANKSGCPQATMTALKAPNDILNPVIKKIRRKESIGNQQQQRVLEQVFARPYKRATIRSERSDADENGSIDSWMSTVLSASPPTAIEGFGRRNVKVTPSRGRGGTNQFGGMRDHYGILTQHSRFPQRNFSMKRSAHSDPEGFTATGEHTDLFVENDLLGIGTENDADNEENSAEEEDTNEESGHGMSHGTPTKPRRFSKLSCVTSPPVCLSTSGVRSSSQPLQDTIASLAPQKSIRPRKHERTSSSSTVLFNPIGRDATIHDDDDGNGPTNLSREAGRRNSSVSSDPKTPQRLQASSRPRPIRRNSKQQQQQFQSTPDLNTLASLGDDDQNVRMLPSSFATQMAMATNDSDIMLNRLVLAKIGALDETVKDIKEILSEVKKMQKKKGKEKEKKRDA